MSYLNIVRQNGKPSLLFCSMTFCLHDGSEQATSSQENSSRPRKRPIQVAFSHSRQTRQRRLRRTFKAQKIARRPELNRPLIKQPATCVRLLDKSTISLLSELGRLLLLNRPFQTKVQMQHTQPACGRNLGVQEPYANGKTQVIVLQQHMGLRMRGRRWQ